VAAAGICDPACEDHLNSHICMAVTRITTLT